MVVCKFGGSSVADSKQIRKVSQILQNDSSRKIAVVSAPGKRTSEDIKVTDMLYSCQREAMNGISISERFGKIRKRYLEIAKELQVGTDKIAVEINEIEQLIIDGASADYAASRGEYLSAKIIALFMGWEFLDTERYIILNTNGTVHASSYGLLAQAIDPDKHYILPGFYGSSERGEIKTFSRGGSDITGSIVARSVKASLYENWTDVTGICMADPGIIKDPKVVHELTYQEIRELASIGTTVFHEEAIAPVRSVRIPICVKNTNDPEADGTMIVHEREDSAQPIVGISGKTGYYRLFVKKFLLNKNPDYELKICTILEDFGVFTEFASIGFDSLAYYFLGDTLDDEEELLEIIREELNPEEVSMNERIAMIGVVGEGLYDAKGILGKVSGSLATAGIPIRFLDYGGSLITCIIGVDDEEYTHALQVMYQSVV